METQDGNPRSENENPRSEIETRDLRTKTQDWNPRSENENPQDLRLKFVSVNQLYRWSHGVRSCLVWKAISYSLKKCKHFAVSSNFHLFIHPEVVLVDLWDIDTWRVTTRELYAVIHGTSATTCIDWYEFKSRILGFRSQSQISISALGCSSRISGFHLGSRISAKSNTPALHPCLSFSIENAQLVCWKHLLIQLSNISMC